MPSKPRPSNFGRDTWRRLTGARTAPEFFRSWLDLQCTSLGATNGVLVLKQPDGDRFVPAANWPGDRPVPSFLAQSAERALTEGKTLVLAAPDRARYAICYVLADATRASAPHGVVALEIDGSPEDTADEHARRLDWACLWLQGVLTRLVRPAPGVSSEALPVAEPATSTAPDGSGAGAEPTAPGSPDVEPVRDPLVIVSRAAQAKSLDAATKSIVADLKATTKSDRVSVGFIEKRQARLYRVSDAELPELEAELRQAIEAAMDEAIDQTLVISSPNANGNGTVIRANNELARRISGTCLTLPLDHAGELTGAITLERTGGEPFSEHDLSFCRAVGAAAGPVLDLERRDERSLLKKCGDSFTATAGAVLGPRYLVRKVIGVALLVLCLALVIFRGEYRVTADALVEGSTQLSVVAPFDGYIKEELKRAGDKVAPGETLARLDDRELQLEKLKLEHEIEQLTKEHRDYAANQDQASARITRSRRARARAELALVEHRIERTDITASMDALIIAGDLRQSIRAPVKRGDVLFQLAPRSGSRVILEVDERDIAEIRDDQESALILTALPEDTFELRVAKVTPVSSAREGRNYFRVEAELTGDPTSEKFRRLRPGMEGIAKVSVGSRSLAWIWTHRAVDWIRLKLWAWLP